MKITRRNALVGVTAAVVGAGVPAVAQARKTLPAFTNTKTREALELFEQLNLARQEISLTAMRMFLDVQHHHERLGLTEEAARSLRRADWARARGEG